MAGPLIYKKGLFGGGFKPTDVDDCAGWWDASDQSSVQLDGGLVSQWNDKSGNGNHLSEATNRPGYTAGVSVNFDGANDSIQGAIDGALPITYFLACDLKEIFASSDNLIGGFSANACALYRGDAAGNYYIFAGTARNTNIAISIAKIIVRVTFADSGIFRINDGGKVTTASPGSTYGGGIRLCENQGGNRWVQADVYEAIAYLSNVSDEDETAIRNYLNDKWAIY